MIQGRLARPLGAAAFNYRESQMRDPAEAAVSEANSALIISNYEALGRGDIQSVFARFSEDIHWHVPGRGPLSRDYRGHAEVQGFFERFMELSGGTFRIHVDTILAKDDYVVVLCTETAQRGLRNWSAQNIHVWTVRDGRATGFREFMGDEQAEDEFWSARI